MSTEARFVFYTSMDISPDKEPLFNEVYEKEHVPLLSKVPGVVSVTRLVTEPLTIILGGERRIYSAEGEPKYTAVYELTGPEVLVSDAWAKVVDKGRWPSEVRPYTGNRRLLLRRIISRGN